MYATNGLLVCLIALQKA